MSITFFCSFSPFDVDSSSSGSSLSSRVVTIKVFNSKASDMVRGNLSASGCVRTCYMTQ